MEINRSSMRMQIMKFVINWKLIVTRIYFVRYNHDIENRIYDAMTAVY